MLTRRYGQVVIAPQLLTTGTLTLANLPAQTVNVPLDTTDPIEEIYIIAQATTKAALAANVVATAQVADGVLNLVKRVRLNVVDPNGPRTPVDISGPALLELQAAESEAFDPATVAAIVAAQSATVLSGTLFRTTYRIPIPHPRFTDILRQRTLLPVHLYDQSPVLQIDVGGAADISGVADLFSALSIEVVVVRRQMTREWNALILAQSNNNPFGWFIPSDIVESSTALQVSLTGVEQRLRVLAPGQISTILLRFFKGQAATWAPTRRATLDDQTTQGAETVWELQQGQNAIEKFRLKHKAIENGFARAAGLSYVFNPLNGILNGIAVTGLTTGTPPVLTTSSVINNVATSQNPGQDLGLSSAGGGNPLIPDPASVALTFTGAPSREIYETGSFLDVTTPLNKNQITEIVGKVTTPASSGSSIKLVTRRFNDAINQLAAF